MSSLKVLADAGRISFLDVHFAGLMMRLAGDAATPGLELAAALVSANCRDGHTCLPLGSLAGQLLPEPGEGKGASRPDCVSLPGLGEWREMLREAPVVGRPGDEMPSPLVLDGKDRLYLHRYWDYERALAEAIRARVAADVFPVDEGMLRRSLDRYFPDTGDGEDRQRLAAVVACMKGLCVISGGPGTGKTWTIARILAVLLEQGAATDAEAPLLIALAAPTGKAAARLQESIAAAKNDRAFPEKVRELIPDEARTLHRLLGVRRGSPSFRHDAGTPLPHDIIVVDEVSMVDLALMAKLVRAVKSGSRLILLGDKDQLASVEAGAVLGDICSGSDSGEAAISGGFRERLRDLCPRCLAEGREGPAEPAAGVGDGIVLLTKSRRMEAGGNVARLSAAVNRGDAGDALTILGSAEHGDAHDLSWKKYGLGREFVRELHRTAREFFGGLREAGSVEEAFELFQGFRILCALREGPSGSRAVNREVERVLGVQTAAARQGRENWYHGRPVMVTRNDYSLGLFNGDMGIAWTAADGGGLRVRFPGPDGSSRDFPPSRIPEHETAYALTVHKSQGSEFDRVLLILPETGSPVLTRELLYTGITRARERVELWGPEEIVRRAIGCRVSRASGLRDALRGG